MKKVPGVENIKVSLTEGMAHIQLAPGNTASLEQLRKAVNEQGFTPKDATVTVTGDLVTKGSETQFKVSGSNDIFHLEAIDAMKVKGVKAVTLRGLVVPSQNGGLPKLQIKEVLKG